MTTEHRKAIVTDEHRAEAAALRRLWEAAKAAGNIASQKDFGERFDIGNQNAVSQFLNAKTPLSLKAARGFAAGLKCEIPDFSVRLAAEADANAQFATPSDNKFESIPQVNGYIYGGSGAPPEFEEVTGELQFQASFLRDLGVNKHNAKIIKVRGNSMWPIVPAGAVVLIKTTSTEPREGKIFAISHPQEGPIIKKLKRTNEGWIAYSENPANNDEIMLDGAKVIGEALWMGAKL